MIPRKIHYCWFGHDEMPQLALDCIASWHKYMPDWEYKLWNESNFDVNSISYAAEAYTAGKYAFVSDYVRLLALKNEGGVYLDTDVVVFKPLDDLLNNKAFAGFEGSKHIPVGTCVMASEAHGEWVTEMLQAYRERHFMRERRAESGERSHPCAAKTTPNSELKTPNSPNSELIPDLTTNVQFITSIMAANGFTQNGKEQTYKDLHIYPVDYFCPRQTTGEYLRNENTYCEHLGLNSWGNGTKGWKHTLLKIIGQRNMTRLIKIKRILVNGYRLMVKVQTHQPEPPSLTTNH